MMAVRIGMRSIMEWRVSVVVDIVLHFVVSSNGLTLLRGPVDARVAKHVVVGMSGWVIIWLHLQDQVTTMSEDLLGTESCAVVIESGVVTLVPPVFVEGIEIIFP